MNCNQRSNNKFNEIDILLKMISLKIKSSNLQNKVKDKVVHILAILKQLNLDLISTPDDLSQETQSKFSFEPNVYPLINFQDQFPLDAINFQLVCLVETKSKLFNRLIETNPQISFEEIKNLIFKQESKICNEIVQNESSAKSKRPLVKREQPSTPFVETFTLKYSFNDGAITAVTYDVPFDFFN
jgi:hypothetical protein